MSNHYHVVLRVDQEMLETWNSIEIIERWTELFNKPVIIYRFLIIFLFFHTACKVTIAEPLNHRHP